MVADTSYLPSPTPVPPDDEGSSVIYLQEAMRKCDVAMCVVAAGMHSRELRRLRLCDAVPALAPALAAAPSFAVAGASSGSLPSSFSS